MIARLIDTNSSNGTCLDLRNGFGGRVPGRHLKEVRHRLPEGPDEALLDSSSLNYIAPLGRALAESVKPLDALLEAFRSGDGVPCAEYGDDLNEGQAAFTKALFENQLAKEWRLLALLPNAAGARVGAGARARDPNRRTERASNREAEPSDHSRVLSPKSSARLLGARG
jgi:hypothetical protein